MPNKYRFTRSGRDVVYGNFVEGDEVELSAAQAKALAPFIVPLEKPHRAPRLETAEAVFEADTADIKPPRRRKVKAKE